MNTTPVRSAVIANLADAMTVNQQTKQTERTFHE